MNRLTFTPPRLGRALTVAAVFGAVALTAGSAHAGDPDPEPTYTVDYRCEEDGAYLEVEVIDESPYRYDVYIDEVLQPEDINDLEVDSDPDGEPWVWGPYADGSDVFVEIIWYTSDERTDPEVLSNGTVTFECSPDDTGVPTSDSIAPTTTGVGGSGGTLPSTGGSDTTLVVTALALLVAGGALLITRRRPHNA